MPCDGAVRPAFNRMASREQPGKNLIERHDWLPAVVARRGTHHRVMIGDALRLRQAGLAPDLRRVATIAEMLQPVGKAPLLGGERRGGKRRGLRDELDRGRAEILDPVAHVAIRAAQ